MENKKYLMFNLINVFSVKGKLEISANSKFSNIYALFAYVAFVI